MDRRIDYLDCAKGFAILGIILYHYLLYVGMPAPLDKAIPYGGAGVHLFFLLSGFGLAMSRAVRTPAQFYGRRLARILPPYYLVVLVTFGLNLVYGFHEDGWYALFGHLLWFKMFDSMIIKSLGGQLWFISTILQCYLAYPLLGWLLGRLGKFRFVLSCLAVSLAWNGLTIGLGLHKQGTWALAMPQFLWEFGLGMVLARLYREQGIMFWDKAVGWYALLFLAAMIPLAVLELFVPFGKACNDYFSMLSFVALSVLAYRAGILNGVLSAAGRISYELYLAHMLALEMANVYLAGPLGKPGTVVVAFGVTWVLALGLARVGGLMPRPAPHSS